jgi:TonB family protein
MIAALIRDNVPFLGTLALASIAFLAIALFVERTAQRTARRLSAASRHTILFAALLVPPVFIGVTAWIPQSSTPAIAGAPAIVTTQIAAAASESKPLDLAIALTAIWLLGVLLSLVRSARSALHWRSVREFADEKEGFAVSHECAEPMVIGIVRPTIVLPAYDYIETLTQEELETVFAHERAHIARRDNLIALIVQMICAFFWFDPLHRIARRRLMALRERACDEAVLERGCDPDSYLAALARSCEAPFRSSAVACMSRLQLRERMELIMTYESRRRFPARIVQLGIGLAIAIAAVAFAVLTPSPNLTAAEAKTARALGEAVDFEVSAYQGPNMSTKVHIKSSVFTGVVNFTSAPDLRTLTTTAGTRTYKWTIQLNSDGSGSTNMDVTEGESLVTTSVKTFAAPTFTTVPPAPPRPGVQRLDPTMKAPKVISGVEPIYPGEEKKNGISGVVILELTIKEDGSVSDVRVIKPVSVGLDQAAVDAVRQWRFQPATKDGKPVEVLFNITINFKLPEAETL